MFSEMAGQGNFEDNADVPMTIVLPAFHNLGTEIGVPDRLPAVFAVSGH